VCGGNVRADALTPALSHRERELMFLRDFFFHRWVEEKRIGPLRLNVAEKKHGGE
jgi:hypothetical protein